MIKIFKDYKDEIENYCVKNNLSAEKIFRSACSYNGTRVVLQHVDRAKGSKGLLDETPAAVTLLILLENGRLRFEQTEITHTYLGAA